MITFNTYPPEERVNSNKPGIYKFIITEIYPEPTSNGETGIKMKLYLPAIYYYTSYKLGINDARISHYLVEQFLLSIGEVYPEDGKLNLKNLMKKEGLVEMIPNKFSGNYLVVEKFINPMDARNAYISGRKIKNFVVDDIVSDLKIN